MVVKLNIKRVNISFISTSFLSSMNLLQIQLVSFQISQTTPFHLTLSSPRINPLSTSLISNKYKPSLKHNVPTTSFSLSFSQFFSSQCQFRNCSVSKSEASVWNAEENIDISREFEDLAIDGAIYRKTLRLVECSMFASVAGLAYFLSNSLGIENYFGCFFSLPIVISSMRWGLAAGRKTMVATAMLLLTLSGPVKASTYLLMHGLVGLAMGSLWRLRASWGLSIFLCTLVRALGATGYVLISSFLIRENILALITINIHASLTYMLTAIGINTIPSMDAIYAIFGILLLLNCGSFVFLLHIIYSVFLTRLGMRSSLTLPRWLEKAI